MDWVLERLKEASTWRGLATLLGAAGVVLSPEFWLQIGAVVGAVLGAIEIYRKEKTNV